MTSRSAMKSNLEPNSPTSIGVFLGIGPDSGGTYQYTLSILNALESLDASRFRLTAFFEDKYWQQHLSERFRSAYHPRAFALAALGKLVREAIGLRRFAAIARWFYPVVRAIERSDCELVIFPGQDPQTYYVRKPALATIHDLMHRYARHFGEYQKGVYNLREEHYRLICARARAILVDSELGRVQVVESYGSPSEMLHPLPFVPPSYVFKNSLPNVRELYDLPERFIVYPAQFWEHKNHSTLIRALRILRDGGIEVPLVLAGGKKNAYDSVIREIQNLRVDDLVTVLGYVPDEHVVALYKTAVALAFVSLIGPTNIPPLEAMALGCPLICSDAYAMPEQVGSGGLLVDASDASKLADAIRTVWQDEANRTALTERGLRRAGQWNQAAFNVRLLAIIEHVLALGEARC